MPIEPNMMPMEQPVGEELEVIIENPDTVSVETEDGGAIVVFGEDTPEAAPFDANLAEYMEESDLFALANDLIEEFAADQRSREDWKKTYMEGLDLLGLKIEERSEPWNGACGVFHPMLTDSVVRFQSQTIQEVFPASGPVKTTTVGTLSNAKTKQSNRVANYMNYSATNEMVEYRTETEKLLFSLPIAGSAFRKVYFDPNLGRNCAMFVPAEDFVVSYGASDLATAPRATHIMKRTKNEVRKLQVSGFYRDVDLDEPVVDLSDIQEKYAKLTGESGTAEHDSRYTLFEMQVERNLKGYEDTKDGVETGIGLPYVITIDEKSMQVLGIRRNWKEEDAQRLKRDHFVHYQYLPGLGFYGFGLVHMIGGLSKSATMLLRQLVDSGTLANLPGGLKSRGLRIKGDDSPIKPGEFRDVDVPGGAIRDNISFLPYKEPSGVLYQLLGDLVNEGRRFASAADVKASDMNSEAPVGTTLAILEREMKVLSAVQARVHNAMGKELKLLADLIRDHGPEEYPYEVDDESTIAEDFDDRVDVMPVSDPNAGTMAQRIMQHQAALQLAMQAPQLYDLGMLHRQTLETLGIQEADKIVPVDEDMQPQDPITETMKIIQGEPVKVFMYQDHEAHIQAHMAASQNPQMQELMQQNPQAEAVMAAGAAHVTEHLAFLFRRKIEEELGTPLPNPDEPLPADIELRLSRLVAPAAAQLTGKAQQQQQAEENAKKQEDPIIQQAKRELDIKEQKVKADAEEAMAKIQSDLQKHQDKIALDREKLALEGAKVAVTAKRDQMTADAKADEIQSREEIAGYQMGMQQVSQTMKRDDK
ncbi:MAG: hypothetical protein ACYTCV_10170 [Planctomycetota bacterium]|jgi:hypothetical protein